MTDASAHVSATSKLIVPAVALLLTVAFGPLGCSDDERNGRILASGHVESTEVRISTKVGGTLEWLAVREGDKVAVGQEIARLDTVDLELALAAGQAQVKLAQAQLRLRTSGFRKEEIAAAEAQVERARVELEAAQRDLDRLQALLEAGSGTTKSRDDAQARRDVASRALKAATEQYQQLRSGFRPEEIEAARAQLDAAEAQVAQLRQQINDATVVSPINGWVTLKLAEQGELLGRGAPLVVVTDIEDSWLTAYLAEPDLGRVRLGQEVTVATDDGSERRGRLTFINQRAEFTPKNVQTRDERVKLVYRIEVTLDNNDGFFKPGMPAEAWLEPITVPANRFGSPNDRSDAAVPGTAG